MKYLEQASCVVSVQYTLSFLLITSGLWVEFENCASSFNFCFKPEQLGFKSESLLTACEMNH